MDLWRDHPAWFCSLFATLSALVGYLLLRPVSWRRFLGRFPLFLVTGGAFLYVALLNLPAALQRLFEWRLGHSIYEIVYKQLSSGTVFGDLWVNRWEGNVGRVFKYTILVSAVWAIINLLRRQAVWSSVLTLVLTLGWACVILWATVAFLPF